MLYCCLFSQVGTRSYDALIKRQIEAHDLSKGATARGVFRILSNIYDRGFSRK